MVGAARELRDQGTYGFWDEVAANGSEIRAAFTG